jgi:hypothetical protein
MTSARFTKTIKDFKKSPEAKTPAPVVPYHDEVRPAPSSTREWQERRERTAREETYEVGTNGRNGLVSEGGSIAQTRTRLAQEITEIPVPTAAELQAETIRLVTELRATPNELEQVASILKADPRRLRDPKFWVEQLAKVRKFNSRRI